MYHRACPDTPTPSLGFVPNTDAKGWCSTPWSPFLCHWSSLHFSGGVCTRAEIPWWNISSSQSRSNFYSKRIRMSAVHEIFTVLTLSGRSALWLLISNLFSKYSLVFTAGFINAANVSSEHDMWVSWLRFTLVLERSAPSAAGRTQRSSFDKSKATYGYKMFSCCLYKVSFRF